MSAPEDIPTPLTRPYLLLVEDSPTTLAVISRNLSEHFDLISANDGEQAWELIQSDPKIELIITDVNMPNMSGIDLLKRIRGSDDPFICELPVFIMTSGDEDDKEKHEALLSGANDFITKPINPLVLRARVNVHHRLSIANRQIGAGKHRPINRSFADPLTGLNNRDGLLHIGAEAFHACQINERPLSALLVNVQELKELEEAYGLQASESILVCVADILQKAIRDVDTVGRIGERLFAALLPGTDQSGTRIIAERVKKKANSATVGVKGSTVEFSVLVGVASYPDSGINSLDDLLNTAENNLS